MNHYIGDALIDADVIDPDQLEQATAMQELSGKPEDQCLVESGNIDEETILRTLSQRYGLPFHRFDSTEIDPEVLQMVPPEIANQYKCVPIGRQNGTLQLAVCNPWDSETLEEVQFAAGCPVEPVLALESEILITIETSYGITVQNLLSGLSAEEEEDDDSDEYFIHDLEEKASEPTVINLMNLLIAEAIEEEASDIHIEPFEKEMKVKYRVDGILHEMAPPPKHLQPALVSRVKIMAGMDIAKRHIPQDGHIQINLPKAKVDIRVSTIPTVFGESVVMRLLNRSAAKISLEELGYSPETYERYQQLLTRSFGIILVCGPTGSGKTTTLYAALDKIYTPHKKIITIEDPVEYQINGINQVPVRASRGMTFAAGLRSILRQDPDILMVGEIRDLETAEIAIRGALTGHLIFSTLHTNDAASAITRLLDMGVEPFLIASSLQGILAQRLVRKLCPHCRKPFQPSTALLNQFDRKAEDVRDITFYEPAGCDMCKGRGYAGRVAISELLMVNSKLQEAVLERQSSHIIKKLARHKMITIREDGWGKICSGITSFEDVLRQTQKDSLDDL